MHKVPTRFLKNKRPCPKTSDKLRKPLLAVLFTTTLLFPWFVGVFTLFQRAWAPSPPPFSPYIQYKHAPHTLANITHTRLGDAHSVRLAHVSIPGYPDQPKEPNDKPLIAIAAPSRSRPTWTSIGDAEVVHTLIPSVVRTVTELERSRYRFKLYLAVDDDDAFWKAQQEHIQDKVPTWLAIEILVLEKQDRIPFNRMMRKTYHDGAEFMVRINDDTEFGSTEWATKGIEMLASYDPPWVGVVGAVETNTKNIAPPANLLPHDFTHRVHMEIFHGEYYPSEFSNWYMDDWITRVYGKARTTKLLDWTLYHHAQDPRYSPRTDQFDLLAPTVQRGQRRIMEWLQGRCENGGENMLDVPFRPVTGERTVPGAGAGAGTGTGKHQWMCMEQCSCSALGVPEF